MTANRPILEGGSSNATIRSLIRNWWVYLLFILLATAAAFFYIRYTTPAFEIHAKILVKDSKRGGDISGSEVFQDLDLIGTDNSVENEVELLKSRTLMEKTITALNLNITYFREGKVKEKEIFHEQIPIDAYTFDLIDDSIKNAELLIEKIDSKSFFLTYQDVKTRYNFGDTAILNFGKVVVIQKLVRGSYVDFPVLLKIYGIDNCVEKFQAALYVAPTTKTVSTIDLTLVDALPQRGEEILNTLLLIYDRMNSEDKNRVADSTILFIDERLSIVSRELGDVEGEIEGFRKSNDMTDISSQSKMLLEFSGEYVKEITNQEVQIEVVKSLENYLKNEGNKSRLVPATLTIQDQTLGSLVLAYNTAQIERDKLLRTTAENNPVLERLNGQIPLLKNDILSNLAVIRNAMIINRDQLRKKINSLETQQRAVPRQERLYLEYSRQQAIKQELYLYLLKKREETAVSKSANLANTRIIDAAKSANFPFKPRQQLIYLIALIAGIIIPASIIYLRDITNTRIITKTDITHHTRLPIIAEIGHNAENQTFIARDGNRSLVAEQFRTLRTNLQYLIPHNNSKSILITSSMSGEGKSFVAINLASAIALSGKKVLLMELDLRKPKISKNLGLRSDSGFSSYAIGKADIDDIIVTVDDHPDLWVIPSGPLPPNPSEILMLPVVDTLFVELKKRFDYIVIDSAPVGLVTDAQLLGRHTDISLFLVRQNYTFKHQVSGIQEQGQNNKLPKLSLVVNDVKNEKGFGFTYGYDNGYYNENGKPG